MESRGIRAWVILNYAGQLLFSIDAIGTFSSFMFELNNHTTFNSWENAWKYRGAIATYLAMSSLGVIASLIGVLTTPFVDIPRNKQDLTIGSSLNHLIKGLSTFALFTLLIASLTITCNLKDQAHKNTCLFYFSWENTIGGFLNQLFVSIIFPSWIIWVERRCINILEEYSPVGEQPPVV